jgi:trafficking protein particle complex subunit 8
MLVSGVHSFIDLMLYCLKHFLDTSDKEVNSTDFKLPITFCLANQTKVRLQSDSHGGDLHDWARREDDWRAFWKTRGKETLDNKRRAVVNGAKA